MYILNWQRMLIVALKVSNLYHRLKKSMSLNSKIINYGATVLSSAMEYNYFVHENKADRVNLEIFCHIHCP